MLLQACRECGALTDQDRCARHRKEAGRRHNARRLRGSGWLAIRARILNRDHHRCTFVANGKRCPATEQLEIHHRNEDPNDNDEANLTTLCSEHHRLVTHS